MNKEYVEEMYEKNVTIIYKFLYSLTHDTGITEELTQETFYQAIKGIDKFQGKCKISVWLCQIAKRLWYKELDKKNKYGKEELKDNVASGENVEHNCLANLDKVEIFKLLHNLDVVTREVMYLRLSGDLSFSQIADIMGKKETWARVTYYRGKEKILKGRKNEESIRL